MTIPELFKLDAIAMLNTLEKMTAEEFDVVISDLTDDELMKIAGQSRALREEHSVSGSKSDFCLWLKEKDERRG